MRKIVDRLIQYYVREGIVEQEDIPWLQYGLERKISTIKRDVLNGTFANRVGSKQNTDHLTWDGRYFAYTRYQWRNMLNYIIPPPDLSNYYNCGRMKHRIQPIE